MNNDSKFIRVCFGGDYKPIDPFKTKTSDYFGGQIGEYRIPLVFIMDESKMGNRVCVACVVVDWFSCLEKFDFLEKQLIEICHTYNLKNIHFTDIVRSRNAHEKRLIFNEIGRVFRDIYLIAISVSSNISEFEENGLIGEKEIYFNLQWNAIELLLNNVLNHISQGAHLLLHLYHEVDNNPTEKLGIEWIKHYIYGQHQINLPERTHILKDHIRFTKKALVFSALADLAAYTNNRVEFCLKDKRVPAKKLAKNEESLIHLYNSVFNDYFSGKKKVNFVRLIFY